MKVKTTEGKKTPVVLLCKNMHQLKTSLQVDRFYHTKKVVALLFENPTAKNFLRFRFLTAKKFLCLAGFKHNLIALRNKQQEVDSLRMQKEVLAVHYFRAVL